MENKHSDKEKNLISDVGNENVSPQLSQKPVDLSPNDQNITPEQEKGVLDKANDRGLVPEYNQDKSTLAVREGSMANDRNFEEYAKQCEQTLGLVAHNDTRSHDVIDEAAQKALLYVDEKAALLAKTDENLRKEMSDRDLLTMGEKVSGSGSVGTEIQDIRACLTSGSFGSKFAHVSNFLNHILKNDLLGQNPDDLNDIMKTAGIDGDSLAIKQAFFGTTKSSLVPKDSPVKVDGEAQNQGLHRVKRFGKGEEDKQAATRNVEDMRARKGEGIDIRAEEVNANHASTKKAGGVVNPDNVQMVEGVRVWAMNERNKWVHAMRQMSLPLGAGVSGTTARMTKGLAQIGVGDDATRRLACIGYLIPYNHHSLVEIMVGASGNGGPAFTPSQRMYRDIAPYSEDFLKTKFGKFPDEAFPTTK
jgi:hypothetical protein